MLLTSLLTFKRIKQNEEYLNQLVDQIVDRFIEKGTCNIVPEFAHAVTTYAISDLMGIPESDRPELLELIGAPPSQVKGDAEVKVGPEVLMKPRRCISCGQRASRRSLDSIVLRSEDVRVLRDGNNSVAG
jgi:cytochrome P450